MWSLYLWDDKIEMLQHVIETWTWAYMCFLKEKCNQMKIWSASNLSYINLTNILTNMLMTGRTFV